VLATRQGPELGFNKLVPWRAATGGDCMCGERYL
jgi:hypothetical protein